MIISFTYIFPLRFPPTCHHSSIHHSNIQAFTKYFAKIVFFF